MSNDSPSSRASSYQEDEDFACAACCAVDGQDEREADLETLIFALVIGGQGMVSGLAVNLTSSNYSPNVYWMLHGWLAASAIIVCVSLGHPYLERSEQPERASLVRGGSLRGSPRVEGSWLRCRFHLYRSDVYYEVVAIVLAIYSLVSAWNRTRKKIVAEVKQVQQASTFAHSDESGQ